MSGAVHLIGAEEVRRAGGAMQDAASTIKQAADSINESFYQQRIFLEEWLSRFEAILKESKEK